ncbi:unnamed protein product [Echinostoma caproni]|uniref:Palmitoyltransferase n=1 Tax=Echinostoma caproni TaxID=27848 RepID=A0A183B9N3_9TREM|nr:unnamed protein product [Echinostoma caproni]
MAGILSCVSVAVLVYFVHHVRLLFCNQTAYEYDRLRALSKHGRFGSPSINSDHMSRRNAYYAGLPIPKSWLYNHGLWANLYEVFGCQTTNSLRELRRRLPVQMEFKTR